MAAQHQKSPEEIKAQEDADRQAAESKARAEAIKEQSKLEERLEKLEQQAAESQRAADEAAQELSELRSQLGKEGGGEKPARILRATALDADKAESQLRAIWPVDGKRLPIVGRTIAKTFKVTPIGKNTAGLAPAIVENCSDEGDAKAAFFKGVEEKSFKTIVKVEPWGETREALEAERQARYAAWDRQIEEAGGPVRQRGTRGGQHGSHQQASA